MEILMHKFAKDGRYITTEPSHSDVDVKLTDITPAKWCVVAELCPLPEYDKETEIPVMTPPDNKTGSWVVTKLAFFERPSLLHEWDGDKWVISLEDAKSMKLDELANARWEEEVGGLVLPNGVEVKTDRESQALLTGAALAALQDPEYSLNWKGSNGWVTLTAADVLGIANAVRAHVQWCFDREKSLVGLVGSAESVEEVQAIIW